MIGLLRRRDFSLLWFGSLISMLGDWMMHTALPIYVYQLTRSTVATSIMFIVQVVPSLLFSSVAGVFVDRWNRKQLMIVCNVLFAFSLLPLLLVRSADWVWLVYVVGFGKSMIAQFFGPAENALLPQIVNDNDLVSANALNSLNNNLARLIGPPIGGMVAGLFSIQGIVVIDALTFVIAGAMLALMRVSGEIKPATDAPTKRSTIWSDLRAGLAVVASQRPLIVAFLVGALCSIGEGVMGVIFIVWIDRVIGGGAQEMGWFMGAQAIGGIIGGLIIGRVSTRIGFNRMVWISGISFGLLDLVLFNYPRFTDSLWVGLGLMALLGIPAIGFFAGQTTLLQQYVSDEYRGRVFGAYSTISAIALVISIVFAGSVGNTIAPMTLLTIQGCAYVLAGLLVLVALREPIMPQSPELSTADPAQA